MTSIGYSLRIRYPVATPPADAVRSFDGSNDYIMLGAGATVGLTASTGITIAMLAKRNSTNGCDLICGANSPTGARFGREFGFGVQASGSGNTLFYFGANTNSYSTTPLVTADGWCVIAVTKAAGTVLPRFHKIPIGGSAVRSNGGATAAASTALTSAARWEFGRDEYLNKIAEKVGLAAVWNVALSDAQIDALAANLRTSDWWNSAAGRPLTLWQFNQTLTTVAVADLTGGGANQTDILETNVDGGDLPPSWYFDGLGPSYLGSLAASAQSAATGAVTATIVAGLVNVPLSNVAGISTSALIVSRPETVTLAAVGATSTATAKLAYYVGSLTSAAQSTATAAVITPQPVALGSVAAQSAATVKFAAVFTGLSSTAQSSATAVVSAPATLPMANAVGQSTSSLKFAAVFIGLPANAQSSATVALTTPTGAALGSLTAAAQSTSSIVVAVPMPIGMAVAAQSTSSANLTYYIGSLGAGAQSTASATVSVPPLLVLNPTVTYAQAVLSDSPIAFWLLDETVGTTATDDAGTDSGTYTGGYVLGTAGPSAAIPTAVTLNGTTGNVGLGSPSNLKPVTGWSVEAWVKFTSLAGTPVFYGTSGSSWALGATAAGAPVLQGTTSSLKGCPQIPGVINTGIWYHIVGTWDGSVIKVYVNGALVSKTDLTGAATSNTGPWAIGESGNSSMHFLNGQVAAVAEWASALTPAQIDDHYFVGIGSLSPTGVASTELTIATPQPVPLNATAGQSNATAKLVYYIGALNSAAQSTATGSVTIPAVGAMLGSLTATAQSTSSAVFATQMPIGMAASAQSTSSAKLTYYIGSLTSGAQSTVSALGISVPGAAFLGTISSAAISTTSGTVATSQPIALSATGGQSTSALKLAYYIGALTSAAQASATSIVSVQQPIALTTGGQSTATARLIYYVGSLTSAAQSSSTAVVATQQPVSLAAIGQSTATLGLTYYIGSLTSQAQSSANALGISVPGPAFLGSVTSSAQSTATSGFQVATRFNLIAGGSSVGSATLSVRQPLTMGVVTVTSTASASLILYVGAISASAYSNATNVLTFPVISNLGSIVSNSTSGTSIEFYTGHRVTLFPPILTSPGAPSRVSNSTPIKSTNGEPGVSSNGEPILTRPNEPELTYGYS